MILSLLCEKNIHQVGDSRISLIKEFEMLLLWVLFYALLFKVATNT